MTVAIVALAAAVVLVLGAALLLLRANRSDAKAITTLRVDNATLRLSVAALTGANRREKGRADALDALLQDLAADRDPAGARERVLARYRREHARAGGDGDGALPALADAGAVAGVDRDGLLRPGD